MILDGAGANGLSNPKFAVFDLYYCKKLGNLFTILGKFSLFLNLEGAFIRPQIWPWKIPDINMGLPSK